MDHFFALTTELAKAHDRFAGTTKVRSHAGFSIDRYWAVGWALPSRPPRLAGSLQKTTAGVY